MIKVQNITKTFGNIKALDSITFEISKGDVVGLLGPNGAGKTTTMRIITSLISPDSGTVEIKGKNIFINNEEAKKIIGYLPEDTPLYQNMTVKEFLEYCAKLKGIENSGIKSSISEVLSKCKIEDVKNRIIGTLSKGYRQRVGLAQALLNNPEILILDEPTVGLDPNQVIQVRNLLKELSRERTIILSTHILPEVEAVCKKVIIIHKGKIAMQADLEEITSPDSNVVIKIECKNINTSFIGSLKNLKGIANIELSNHEGKTYISLEADKNNEENLREAIYKNSIKNNVILLEMKKERKTLESIFIEVTGKL